jgi:hypothetical protein
MGVILLGWGGIGRIKLLYCVVLAECRKKARNWSSKAEVDVLSMGRKGDSTFGCL